MKKFLLSAVVAFAAFASNAGAQAIVITKSNDAKIVLPSGNVKEITTTTEEVGESLDYYTKEENDDKIALLEKMVYDLTQTVQNNNEQSTRLMSIIAEQQTVIAALQEKVKMQEDANEYLDHRINENFSFISGLVRSDYERHEQLAELQKYVTDVELKTDDLQCQTMEAKCMIVEQGERISILEKENSNLKMETLTLRDAVDWLSMKLNELESKK